MNGLMKTENLSQTMLGYYSKKITCFLLAQVVWILLRIDF